VSFALVPQRSRRAAVLAAWSRRSPAGARRRRWVIGAGVLLAVVAGIGGWRWTHRVKAVKIEYRDQAVAKSDLKVTVSAAADVSPQNRIELTLPVAGRIESILVREGDDIRKGQVLAWVSSYDRAALLDAARAKGPEELRKWEDLYKPTPLVAPLAGFIIARRQEPGQTGGTGTAPLVMADRLIVRAQVDETDMAKVRVGQHVEVVLDAYPELKLPGRLDHLAFEARNNNNVTVYDIEVELLKDPRVLRSGMTATVSVTIAERKGVLAIPAEALTEKDGKLTVLVKGPKGPPAARPVQIGITDGAQVEVVKGLKEGEVLLVNVHGLPPSSLANTNSPFMPKWGGKKK